MNFTFLNIPVRIHPTFWIFLLFFTEIYRHFSLESVILGAVLFISLLVHEFGHALTAQYFGAKPTVSLEAFGGRAYYNGFGLTPKQEFLITLNGPLLESLLIALSYYLIKMNVFENYYIRYFLHVTFQLNVLWCVLNLIPVLPLDGGHLVRYFLEKKFGVKGSKASLILSMVCCVIAVPCLFKLGFFFFAILLGLFGFQNFKILQRFKQTSGEVNPFSTYMKGVEAIKEGDLEKAKVLLKKLLQSQDEQIKHKATEAMAKIYLTEADSQKSYELLLKSNPELLKEGKCLLCRLALQRKNYALVAKHSREIYTIEPSFEIAVLNSKAFAGLNQVELAVGWLQTAAQFEEVPREEIDKVLHDSCYDSIRHEELFKHYVEQIAPSSDVANPN